MANLPNTFGFLRDARLAFDRAARVHTASAHALTPRDRLDGARRTLAALDDAIRELQACRAALALYIEGPEH